MNERLWILGAPDPEMELIESLLREAGEPVGHATVAGCRVHPGNAYRADGYVNPGESVIAPESAQCSIYLVECGFPDPRLIGINGAEIVIVDHHRPGDPGYGRLAADYLSASSIGQVFSLLGGRLAADYLVSMERYDEHSMEEETS